MAELEEKLKVLEALSTLAEPSGASDVSEITGQDPLRCGYILYDLARSGLVEKPDKKKKKYNITEKGKEFIENPPEETFKELPKGPLKAPPKGELPEEPSEEIALTVPSQSDLFKGIGERLGVGARKGDVRLDAIIYYVQRTANLDNLSSVWNALTDMGVANDVKKRWIRLYAQNLPGKEIPEELKEKLEIGMEGEKVSPETKLGEVPPKPKRFSVVGSEIVGDPEGDLNFKEALQYVAQQKGVPPDQANPLAAMVEAMKLGPEMATATLSALIPLMTPGAPQQDTTLSQILQTLRDIGAFGKEGGGILDTIKALKELGMVGKPGEGEPPFLDQIVKLGELGFLRKPGEGEGGASEPVRALEAEVKELRDELRTKEIEGLKGSIGALANQLTELRNQMATQGTLEGRFAIMEKALSTGDSQLTGLRTDIKGALDMITQAGGPGPKAKSTEERTRLSKGLKDAVKLEQRAHELEEELLFGGSTP